MIYMDRSYPQYCKAFFRTLPLLITLRRQLNHIALYVAATQQLESQAYIVSTDLRIGMVKIDLYEY